MEVEAYRAMAAHEDHHWWFVGRRAVISALLDRIEIPADARILEAACGTGGNLYVLAERGTVAAFEPHEEARRMAVHKHPDGEVVDGELPFRIPFGAEAFDLVVALDVLEHVNEDGAALRALVGRVRPGGAILVTVPAIQALWGSHDRRLHHVRRYDKARLLRLIDDVDMEIELLTYFNTVLAPIAFGYRLLKRALGRDLGNQERVPPPLVNRLLAWLFRLERHLVRRGTLPAGLSLGVILRRPRPAS